MNPGLSLPGIGGSGFRSVDSSGTSESPLNDVVRVFQSDHVTVELGWVQVSTNFRGS